MSLYLLRPGEPAIKYCPRCTETKPFSEFNKETGRRNGCAPYCRMCSKSIREEKKEEHNAYRKAKWNAEPEYRQKYLDYHRARYRNEKDKLREYQRQHYSDPVNKLKYLYSQARNRARNAAQEFTIRIEDIVIPTHCPYLGVELTALHRHGRVDTNMSIDRIDSTKGYITGNVQIISDKANRMKNDASIEELIAFAKGVLEKHA